MEPTGTHLTGILRTVSPDDLEGSILGDVLKTVGDEYVEVIPVFGLDDE